MVTTTAAPPTESPIRVEPFDEHNQRLVANVHPPQWKNPDPKARYHLVAIGAGAGGLVSSAVGASLGAKVALIEKHLLGGDCLNVGCVPSKGVISAARAWHGAFHAAKVFGGPQVTGVGDFGAAMERMRRLRAQISHGDSAARYRDLGVDVFLGHARFVSREAVEVAGRRLTFRRAVIASGGRAAAPPIAGLDAAGYLTNETVFTLTELPKRLAVIGAGPIGCEMAQSFARFGSQVTILQRGDHILPREDADAAAIVERAMARDGVMYLSGTKILRAESSGGEKALVYERDGKEEKLACDRILVAVGRAPNVEGLDLEAADVEYSREGVKVDDRLRTSNPRIYAVGDVCSRYQFTHASDAQAQIAVANALFFGRRRASRLAMPWCTYTSPEIAHVGFYEKDATEAGYDVHTITVPLDEVDRAVLDGEAEGFFRVHLKKGSDRILGATLVAAHAGDMISEISVALNAGVGLKRIAGTIHPYPTQAEVFRKAAYAYGKTRLSPGVKKLLGLFFKVFR
jgi:pyruvate/2-oxoglutarate dehydrogenase complex dihydrolipoamide dehydrogenase (E3) component